MSLPTRSKKPTAFDSQEECERDVEARLLAWGFASGGVTELDKAGFLHTLGEISKLARVAMEGVQGAGMPCRNSAVEAIRAADKAIDNLTRAFETWLGY
jgi:hypothetical protein